MVRTHKIVEKSRCPCPFYIDGVQVGASVFPGGNCDIETQKHDWDEFALACQQGGVGFDSVEVGDRLAGATPEPI